MDFMENEKLQYVRSVRNMCHSSFAARDNIEMESAMKNLHGSHLELLGFMPYIDASSGPGESSEAEAERLRREYVDALIAVHGEEKLLQLLEKME